MNGWQVTTVTAEGTTSSEALVLEQTSPWMIFNVITSNDPETTSVQLPISPNLGDFVEVCVGSDMLQPGVAWIGTTALGSSTTHYDQIDIGKCRSYRYVSGSYWNRYD